MLVGDISSLLLGLQERRDGLRILLDALRVVAVHHVLHIMDASSDLEPVRACLVSVFEQQHVVDLKHLLLSPFVLHRVLVMHVLEFIKVEVRAHRREVDGEVRCLGQVLLLLQVVLRMELKSIHRPRTPILIHVTAATEFDFGLTLGVYSLYHALEGNAVVVCPGVLVVVVMEGRVGVRRVVAVDVRG